MGLALSSGGGGLRDSMMIRRRVAGHRRHRILQSIALQTVHPADRGVQVIRALPNRIFLAVLGKDESLDTLHASKEHPLERARQSAEPVSHSSLRRRPNVERVPV